MDSNYSMVIHPTGIIIIDFDNLFKQDISDLTPEILEFEFKKFVSFVISENNNLTEIIIRLYGGWYKDEALTNNASSIQQMLASVNVFPFINTSERIKIRGKIELASSLFSMPSLIWKGTYKEKHGVYNMRINRDALSTTCEDNPTLCPPKILNRFTKKKNKICSVEGCSSIHKNIFKAMEQKMVDTMIACDILSCSDEELIQNLIIVSEDTDIFPSLVLGKQKSRSPQSVSLLIKNERFKNTCEAYLVPFQINVKLYQ